MKKSTPKHRILIMAFVLGAIASTGLLACSPQEGAPSTTDKKEVTQADFTWSEDSDCSTCHKTAIESFDDSSCTSSKHADMKDNCFTCHTDAESLATAHSSVKGDSVKKKPGLKKTSMEKEVCLSCHSTADLAAAAEESTALTDKNGLVVNPHLIPENEDHANADINCSSCHKFHVSEDRDDTAKALCQNCHHAGIFECHTCHAEK